MARYRTELIVHLNQYRVIQNIIRVTVLALVIMSAHLKAGAKKLSQGAKSNRYFDETNQRLSGLAFGNTAGIGNNVIGRLYRSYARLNAEGDVAARDDATVAQLRSEGYVHLGQAIDDETIQAIQPKFDELIEDEDTSVVRGAYEGKVYSRIVHNSHERLPELSGIVNEEVVQTLESYFDAHFKPVALLPVRNYHVPPEVIEEAETFANYWHFDQHFTAAIKLFVLLSDVDEDDGPLHIAPKIDSKRLARKGFRRYESGVPNRIVENHADVIRFTGPAGSAMLGETHSLLHRAGNPSPNRQRDMVILQLAPSTKPLSDDWLDHVPSNFYDRERKSMYGEETQRE